MAMAAVRPGTSSNFRSWRSGIFVVLCELIYDWKGSETGLDGEIEDVYFSNAVNDRFKHIGPSLVFPSRGYLCARYLHVECGGSKSVYEY